MISGNELLMNQLKDIITEKKINIDEYELSDNDKRLLNNENEITINKCIELCDKLGLAFDIVIR